MMLSVYHGDPQKTNELLEQTDPDYGSDDDYFDAEGFELLKAAMGESGSTEIK